MAGRTITMLLAAVALLFAGGPVGSMQGPNYTIPGWYVLWKDLHVQGIARGPFADQAGCMAAKRVLDEEADRLDEESEGWSTMYVYSCRYLDRPLGS